MSSIPELSGPIGALAGWLATYALHSTILLAFAALVAPRLRSDAWRETLWRTALLGALVTATVQAAVGFTPVVGRWTVGQAATPLPPAANESSAETLTPGEILPPDQATQEGATSPAAPTQTAEKTQPTEIGRAHV